MRTAIAIAAVLTSLGLLLPFDDQHGNIPLAFGLAIWLGVLVFALATKADRRAS